MGMVIDMVYKGTLRYYSDEQIYKMVDESYSRAYRVAVNTLNHMFNANATFSSVFVSVYCGE